MSVALGASPRDVAGAIAGPALRLTAVGLLTGLGLAVPMSSMVQNQLVGVSPFDPVSLAGSLIVLVLVALGTCVWPVWTAVRLDPVSALRGQ